MENEIVRIFFAIALNDQIKNLITNHIEQLKKTCSTPVKWVKDGQLHLTLRFLGNIPVNQLTDIYNSVSELKTLHAFNLEPLKLIAFPENKPRIIGVAIKLSDELATLIAALNERLKALGIAPEERVFLPHITLGRVAQPKRKPLILDEIDLLPNQAVTHITLYKSHLTPEGSYYTVLKEFPLGEL